LCQEVWEKESFQFDRMLLLGLHQWAHPILDQIMLSITRLADPEFVVAVVGFNLGWLLWRRRRLEATVLAIACGGALVLNQGMKLVFAHPHPFRWTPLMQEPSYALSSGHALGALVLYGLLAHLVARQYPRFTPQIYGVAIAAIALIGLSRLYLGIHCPTDMMAGYAVGFLWLMLCIAMLKFPTNFLKLYQ
jgi:undecaprenyl-diphosphatase